MKCEIGQVLGYLGLASVQREDYRKGGNQRGTFEIQSLTYYFLRIRNEIKYN